MKHKLLEAPIVEVQLSKPEAQAIGKALQHYCELCCGLHPNSLDPVQYLNAQWRAMNL